MSDQIDASSRASADEATIGFDDAGRVHLVSESAARLLGYTDGTQLAGKSLSDLIGKYAAEKVLRRVESEERIAGISPGEIDSMPYQPDASDSIDGFADEGRRDTAVFVRQDGTRIPLNTVVTAEPAGGWITLIGQPETGPGSAHEESPAEPSPDAGEVIRQLAAIARDLDDPDYFGALADRIRDFCGRGTVIIARSSDIGGVYEVLAISTDEPAAAVPEVIELPRPLIPPRDSAPVEIESLESLALFEPLVLESEELTGRYVASRAELPGEGHLLIIATSPAHAALPGSLSLILDSSAPIIAGRIRTTGLETRLAVESRHRELVRTVGALAAKDHEGSFLDETLRAISRRMPVSALSIHAADLVTGRIYVAAASGEAGEEFGSLAPSFEWPLAGSLEQQIMKSRVPVFISGVTTARVSVSPVVIKRWRESGIQAVVALPMREAGEVIAVLVAGFNAPVSDHLNAIRVFESLAPAIYLGVGLSGGSPAVATEPDETDSDPGFVSPKILLAVSRAAADSPDPDTLFASVTEWLLEVIPTTRVAWGIVDIESHRYHRRYFYDTSAAAHPDEEIAELSPEQMQELGAAGLKLAEPGSTDGNEYSMRVPVSSDQRVLGVVTAQHRDSEPFSGVDLARLERICEYVAGPLSRILDVEQARELQQAKDAAGNIGTQAARFLSPSRAFSALRPALNRLLRHERAIYLEVDDISGQAEILFDSADGAQASIPQSVPIELLPSPAAVESPEPVFLQNQDVTAVANSGAAESFFGDYASALSIPISSGDGAVSVLVLLGDGKAVNTERQRKIAACLGDQLAGARAAWQASRSTRESVHDIRETRRQLSLLLSRAPVVLINTDASGVCTRLEGHGLETLSINQGGRDGMLGRSIFEVTGKLPELEDAIRQGLRGLPTTSVITLGSHSAEVWAQPVTENDGSVIGVTVVGYDISERIRSRRALAEKKALHSALQDRSRIVSTVSHELRNPLSSIIAYTDIISATAAEHLTPQQQQALGVIQKSANHLNTLISDLLGPDSGNFQLDTSQVVLNDLLGEIVDAQAPIFDLAEQALKLELPKASYAVEADHLRLTQVITNLLSNASKYSPKHAKVTISLTLATADARISVKDTGPGIPANQLDRVWDPGIRIPNSMTTTVPGSGLGLYIARKIVELHGGSASIESKVGVGTTVTVSLPGASAVGEQISTVGDVGDPGPREDEPARPRRKTASSRSAAARSKKADGRAARQRRRA